ncbi:MAG: hypothetical protein RIR11_383 [Bacteroidota bacterium]|jgi:membrane protease YdiL (CAAX protease family)
MQYDLSWSPNDFTTFWVILLSTFFFSVYWFIFVSERIKQGFYAKYEAEKASEKHVLFTKASGFVLMGILPFLVFMYLFPKYSLADYGISLSKGTNLLSLKWIVFLCTLVLILNWFAARREKTFSMYPQMRIKEWDTRLILTYSMGWVLYLFGYEALFRGYLFFPLVETMGVWPAIAVNTALYSATHIPKGMDETIGAPILGVILCLITLQTGTIWVAFAVHVALALSNSLIALKFHPEMKIIR